MSAEATVAASAATAEFADWFQDGWAIGARDPERFFAHIAERLTPDALMTQPLAAPLRGESGMRRLFTPLFRAIPDLHGEVVRWGATADGVMIELRLSGTLGRRPVSWITVDRIVLRDGRIAERAANFDPLPLAWALARSPRAARVMLPALLRRGGR
jgi:ketosteroid isomerase-like protein